MDESGSIKQVRIGVSRYARPEFTEYRTHYSTATLEEKEWWLWWCYGVGSDHFKYTQRILDEMMSPWQTKHGPKIDPDAGPMLPW